MQWPCTDSCLNCLCTVLGSVQPPPSCKPEVCAKPPEANELQELQPRGARGEPRTNELRPNELQELQPRGARSEPRPDELQELQPSPGASHACPKQAESREIADSPGASHACPKQAESRKITGSPGASHACPKQLQLEISTVSSLPERRPIKVSSHNLL